MSEQKWYVAYTKPKAEFQLREAALRKEIQVYVPVDYRQAPLFPSYVFVNLKPSELHLIRYLPGFSRFVSFGEEPAVISDSQISTIKRISEFSPHARALSSRLVKGDQVRIVEGPLRGIIGTLIEDQEGPKVAMAVPQLNQSLLVSVPVEYVVPADSESDAR